MQPVLTAEEVYTLLDSVSNEEIPWISNDTQRREKYYQIIKSGDRKEILKLIKTLYRQKQKGLQAGGNSMPPTSTYSIPQNG